MYNADQLRATCQQYIAINLAALLEARYVQRRSAEATCQQYIAINLAALLEARYVQHRSAESHMSTVYSHQPGSLTGGKVCTTQIS